MIIIRILCRLQGIMGLRFRGFEVHKLLKFLSERYINCNLFLEK